MKHLHHIIPKHMRGLDHPDNLIELTVEEHAEAHKKLYEQYGKTEDKIAWLALSGIAKKEDVVQEKVKLGRLNANKTLEQKYGKDWKTIIAHKGASKVKEILANDPDYLKKFARPQNGANNPMHGKKHSDKTKKLMSEKASGKNGSQYGTMWIHSLEEKRSKKIKKDDPIPKGWIKGRKIKF